jgi:thiol-disulfide isomerase/thioredoxin
MSRTTIIILLRYSYKKLICAFVYLTLTLLVSGQSTDPKEFLSNKLSNEGLTIGDKVPDFIIDNIVNYTTKKSKVSQFQNKLLILDFMTTSCKGCIELLPKLDALQVQFEGKAQIMMVTPEKAERVNNFLQKNKLGKQTKLPFATSDSTFNKYFPHEYISHIAWVYKGIVVAITKSQYIKANNIQTILDGTAVNWPVKKDVKDYDYSSPLFIHNEDNIPYSSLPVTNFYSGFSTYMAGIPSKNSYHAPRKSNYIPDSVKKIERFFMINSSIIGMYLRALNVGHTISKSKMILEVKDKDKVIYDSSRNYRDVWRQEYMYCYEIIFPFGIPENKKVEKIRNDLNYYLGMDGRIETRKIKCLILTKATPGDSVLKATFIRYYKPDGTLVQNTSIAAVLYRLNNSFDVYPALDETGYMERMYMQLDPDVFSDINKLRLELKKYGLELKEAERQIEMFVLTEKN